MGASSTPGSGRLGRDTRTANQPFKERISVQETLLLQRDRATRLSVEILQLKNSPGPIVWHYLRDPTFSRFDTIPECGRYTDTQIHDDGIYRA